MGEICSTHGEQERCIQCFGGRGGGELKGRDHFEDKREDNIKMDLEEVGCGGMN
jgi:hypothetical protein